MASTSAPTENDERMADDPGGGQAAQIAVQQSSSAQQENSTLSAAAAGSGSKPLKKKQHYRRRPQTRRGQKGWNSKNQQYQPMMLNPMAVGGQNSGVPVTGPLLTGIQKRFYYPHNNLNSNMNAGYHCYPIGIGAGLGYALPSKSQSHLPSLRKDLHHLNLHHYQNNNNNNNHHSQQQQQQLQHSAYRNKRRDQQQQGLNWRHRNSKSKKDSRKSTSKTNNNNNNNNNNNDNNNSSSKVLCKRLSAPYNTTQFLMDDHNNREPELDGISKLIRRSIDESGEEHPHDEQGGPDRLLHTLNDESSSEEFYSSPDDEQDFMEKQFTETYDSFHAERLGLMSKSDLVQECLQLEARLYNVESELKFANSQLRNDNVNHDDDDDVHEDMITEEDEMQPVTSDDQKNFASTVELKPAEIAPLMNQEHLDANVDDNNDEDDEADLSSNDQDSDEDSSSYSSESRSSSPDHHEHLNQMANEIHRLTEENQRLRIENERLIKVIEGKENIEGLGLANDQ